MNLVLFHYYDYADHAVYCWPCSFIMLTMLMNFSCCIPFTTMLITTYWLKKGMLHVFIPQTPDPFHKPCSTSANEDMFPADLDEIH